MKHMLAAAIAGISRRHTVAIFALALAGTVQADLLTNGNFNADADSNGKPDNWNSWAWSNDPGGWSTFADYKTTPATDPWSFDGTPYINAGLWGAWDTGGSGWFQENSGAEGKAYSFAAFSGSEAWSTGAGELRLIYLDAGNNVIRQDVQHTVYYVAGKPWAPYIVASVAPAGTVKVKTEFATWGARGTVMWDNGTLVETSIWNLPVGGDFLTATNWTGPVPNAVDAAAQFTSATSSDEVISIDDAVILGQLGMKNAATYQLAGLGSLKMQTSAGDALIVAGQGTQRINLPLTIASTTAISASDNTWLRVSKPVTVNAGMKLTQYGTGTVTYESSLTLQANASMNFTNSMHPTALNLGANASAVIAPKHQGGLKVLTVDTLSIGSGAKLDVNDNALVVDYSASSPLASVRSSLKSGYANGAWNGEGIVSGPAAGVAADPASTYRTGLAYGEAASLPAGALSDLALADNTAVVVRYTVMGDSNLDLKVDSTDFDAFVSGYGKTTNGVWTDGDFDYDGKVSTTDFNVLAGSFGGDLNPPATAPSLGGVVPEPASLSLLALGGLGMFRRRRD